MENFEKLSELKVSRDPILGYINIEYKVIWDLINTKEMQRLRRVHQLGGTHQVFASSEHSRFTHSLGAYENAKKIVETVDDINKLLSEEEKLTVLCAALLHDVGHGPFSHGFEAIHPIHHELYSVAIIEKDSDVNRVLKSISPEFPFLVSSVIKKTHPNPILSQIVSSQIDADRMDYLLRDAYFTGTPYGYFDIERILRVMKVKNNIIVFKASGVSAIENYVMGRYHMYNQVYYHPTSISYETIFSKMLTRLKDLYHSNYKFKESYRYLIPFFSDEMVVNIDHFNLDEPSIFHYAKLMQDEDDAILSDLARRFLNRDLFKYKVVDDERQVEEIKNQLIAKGYDPKYYFQVERPVQVVYKRYGRQDMTAINILTSKGEIKELSDVSLIVKALSQSRYQTKGEITVFAPKFE
jgi:hypothetical protein